MANTKWDSKFNNTPFIAMTEADVIALVNKALSCGSAHATTYKYAFSYAEKNTIFPFEKQNYYEWIKYLEKANLEEDSYALANKLDVSTERQNLSSYRDVLVEFKQTRCFYCGHELKDASDSAGPVDHFIPWSFVKDDKLWNFVLACPHCNSSKSNILPDRQYFTEIKERNRKLCNVDLPIVKHDFKSYSYFKLEEMWHSAIFNGFEDGWRA